MNRSLIMPLALAIVFASRAAYAEPAAAQREVAFELDTSALPEDWSTDYIKVHLVKHQLRILQQGGLEVVDGATTTIRVILSRYGKNDIHYRFTVALYQEGAEAAAVERTLSCEACSDTDLFIRVGEEVARQSGGLIYAGEDEGEPQGEQAPSTDPQPSEDTTPPAAVRRVGGWGYAGIGLVIAGVGFGAWATAVIAREPTREFVRNSDRAEEFSKPRRRGRQLVYGSAGLLLVGAALIAVDQTALLKRRRHQTRGVSVIPSFSTTGASLSLVRRF